MDILALVLLYVLMVGLSVTSEELAQATDLPSSLFPVGHSRSCQGTECHSSAEGQSQGSRSTRSRGSKFTWRQVWTPCSVSCGVGLRRRVALCINTHRNHSVREGRCRRNPKPYLAVSKCQQPLCSQDAVQNDDPSSLSLSPSTELFKKHFGNLFKDQAPSLPSFFTGDWSLCSVTCATGQRSREVTCKVYNTYTGKEELRPDKECLGTKPAEAEECDRGPCRGDLPYTAVRETNGTYHWHIGEFTQCSRSCLGGTQESRLRCIKGTDSTSEVSPSHCSGLRKPPAVTRSCNTKPCPPRWHVGEYGACSQDCGGGVMRRKVRCVQDEAAGHVTPLEHFRCPDPVPLSDMSCNNVHCSAVWAADDWQECSKTCGVGIQQRRVHCVKEPVRGHRVSVSDSACAGPRPSLSRRCSKRDCADGGVAAPFIQAENYTFIQLRRAKRVKLRVGGKVVLLPGQSIVIRCPVKNYHRRLIFWSKRFKLVPMVGRVRATLNGNLKIRKANPVADSGTYTCMAGPQSAEVHIQFQSRKDALQKMKDIQHYLHTATQSAVVLKPGEPSYQDGVFQDGGYNVTKKFLYMTDDWSPCSVTCGSGHQKRRVTCSRVTSKYVKILQERECEKLGVKKPENSRKCSPQPHCPHWSTGSWSQCSLQHCIRDGYAERRRKLDCQYSNGTLAKPALCSQGLKPEAARQCVNIDCISHWTTSKWTACRPSCGFEGSKRRMLTCSWRKTGLPAWTACRHQARPLLHKPCKLQPCPDPTPTGCQDKSRYCSLARMLKMCRFDDFRRNCCRSCTNYLQSTLARP